MFPEIGRPLDAVLSEILRIREKDPRTEDGTILGTMITTPHPISLKVVSMYLSSTLSDSIIFEEAARLEREVVAALGDLLNDPNIMGTCTSGGSEANVLGSYMLR
ncbi:MAG TPA: tyrosine decarboxylase MfnA, partial [Thermoprotei archaeon]|nr:tyrosine decarboxylase MfnA [Thermoprotei archaeon]